MPSPFHSLSTLHQYLYHNFAFIFFSTLKPRLFLIFTIKQAFMIHIPGFDNGTGEHPTISFESACAPSHFVRQKNYKFVLGKKGDTKFGKFI